MNTELEDVSCLNPNPIFNCSPLILDWDSVLQ